MEQHSGIGISCGNEKGTYRLPVSACYCMAGVPGFEPRVTASEAVALPFGDTPIFELFF